MTDMADATAWIVPRGVVNCRGPLPKSEQEDDAEPGQWFACCHPERPFDGDACLHDCCAKCLLAVTAAVANGYQWGAEGGASVVDLLAERLAAYGEAPNV